MDSSFTSDQFQSWVDQTISKDPHINFRLSKYGPESFLLYYLIPSSLNSEEQIFTQEGVLNRLDYRSFLSNLIDTTLYDHQIYEIHYLPNFEDGPTVVFGFQPILFDPSAFYRWLRLASDVEEVIEGTGYQPSQTKMLMTAANGLTGPEKIPSSDVFKSQDMEQAKVAIYQLPSWDLHRALQAARAHNMSLNDIFLAALSSSYTAAHPNPPQYLLHCFGRNMRSYTGATRFRNESSYGFLSLPGQSVSLQYLKHIVNQTSKLKENFQTFIENYSSSYSLYWGEMNVVDPLWRKQFMIMSSNIKGPDEYLYIRGSRVNHITLLGSASYCAVSLTSYVGKLTANLVYAKEIPEDVIERYSNGLNDAWHAYVDILMGQVNNITVLFKNNRIINMVEELKVQLAKVQERKQSAVKEFAEITNFTVDDLEQSSEIEGSFDRLICEMRKIVEAAGHLSAPVIAIDAAKVRLQSCSVRVNSLISLKMNLGSLAGKMKQEDYESAADLIQKIEDILRFVQFVPEDDRLYQTLKSDLTSFIEGSFGTAVAENDEEKIEQYAKLFHPLGIGNRGIEKYCAYIIVEVRQKSQQNISLIKAGNINCEDGLKQLFRSAFTMLENHKPMVVGQFGLAGLVSFMQHLQQEVDSQALLVYDEFLRDRKLTNFNEEELKDVYQACEEMTDLIKHSESFEAFLGTKAAEVVTELGSDWNPQLAESEGRKGTNGLLRISGLKDKLQELSALYLNLESFFMQRTVAKCLKAITLENLTQTLIQSKEINNSGANFEKVDEVFFVMRNSTVRAFNTYNIDNICAVINFINDILDDQILNKLRNFTTRGVQCGEAFTAPNCRFILSINLLETANNCTQKLIEGLNVEFLNVFDSTEGNEYRMFEQILANLKHSGEMFHKTKTDFLAQLITSSIFPTLQRDLAVFNSVQYNISEEKFSDYEINDPFAHRFIENASKCIAQWKSQLIQENFEYFIDYVAQHVVEYLETYLRKQKFSELGAMQLEKDTRGIEEFFQSQTSKHVRARFARLRTIVKLLASASVNDAFSIYDKSNLQGTAREYLQLRFTADEINTIK